MSSNTHAHTPVQTEVCENLCVVFDALKSVPKLQRWHLNEQNPNEGPWGLFPWMQSQRNAAWSPEIPHSPQSHTDERVGVEAEQQWRSRDHVEWGASWCQQKHTNIKGVCFQHPLSLYSSRFRNKMRNSSNNLHCFCRQFCQWPRKHSSTATWVSLKSHIRKSKLNINGK